MTFNTILFLFAFLPISLFLYYAVPKRFRTIPLVLTSLVFYAWGNPTYLLLMAFSVGFNYITGVQIAAYQESVRDKGSKVSMVSPVLVNLLVLGFFKYFGFLISTVNSITGLKLSSPDLPLPLGISFFTFSVLSYVFDVYRKRAEVQKNFLDFTLFVTFFPKVISGPIIQYKDMAPQLRDRKMAPAKFGAGINLFLVGLAKKVLLADNLGATFSVISGMSTMSAGTAWLGMILYSLQLYFDFSGYSDMAIGLAKLFGFSFEKNFDYPYLSTSISEFWRRWHISLGAWFRDYVYIPLGGNRCTKHRQLINLSVVWLLTGLWHGASWNFVLWGVYHGIFVILEKFALKDVLPKVPKVLRTIVTTLLVFLGWVLFFSPSLSSAVHYYGQMFGAGHMGLFDGTFRYYFFGSLRLLILAVIGCGPLAHTIHQRLCYYKGGKLTYVSVACYVLLLILCVAYMMSATYSSFLYVQF